jgi:hypothetical protein
MSCDRSHLQRFYKDFEEAKGLYVRIHGQNLIIGREEVDSSNQIIQNDDRVRLTRISKNIYGLSAKHHSGRWNPAPFSGTLEEMVEIIFSLMQHVVAAD